MSVLNDWFIKVQQEMIQSKLEMIKFLNQDLGFTLQLKEKTDNVNLIFELEHIIKTNQEYIRALGESIEFNRRLINERKLRLRNNQLNRDESGAGPEGRTRNKVVEQYSFVG